MNTVYIAGKISGDADYRQKFNEAQETLEKRGFAVMNPAWMPSEGFSYEAYIRIGKAMLKECSIFCLLPDWEESAGACNELQLAASLKKEIMYYSDMIAETDNDTPNIYYYKFTIQGNADYFRRRFGQKYECLSSASVEVNETEPSHCDYVIKTEIKPDDMDKYKAVNILASATSSIEPIKDNDIAELCIGVASISEEDVSRNGIDIKTEFSRRVASPYGVYYTSS